jgi:hypothetical protein
MNEIRISGKEKREKQDQYHFPLVHRLGEYATQMQGGITVPCREHVSSSYLDPSLGPISACHRGMRFGWLSRILGRLLETC